MMMAMGGIQIPSRGRSTKLFDLKPKDANNGSTETVYVSQPIGRLLVFICPMNPPLYTSLNSFNPNQIHRHQHTIAKHPQYTHNTPTNICNGGIKPCPSCPQSPPRTYVRSLADASRQKCIPCSLPPRLRLDFDRHRAREY